ncbi:MAG: hypothetical protein WBD95_27045 [Xanthobacteraceae bacterium]
MHQRGDPAADIDSIAAAYRTSAALGTNPFAAVGRRAGRFIIILIVVFVPVLVFILVSGPLVVVIGTATMWRQRFSTCRSTLKSHAVPAVAFCTNAISLERPDLYCVVTAAIVMVFLPYAATGTLPAGVGGAWIGSSEWAE